MLDEFSNSFFVKNEGFTKFRQNFIPSSRFIFFHCRVSKVSPTFIIHSCSKIENSENGQILRIRRLYIYATINEVDT